MTSTIEKMKKTGNFHSLWLEGLSTTLLSIFHLEKSILVDATLMAENMTYGFKYCEKAQPPSLDFD